MLDISLELKGESGNEQNLTLASCLRRQVPLLTSPDIHRSVSLIPLSHIHALTFVNVDVRFTHPEKLGPNEYSCEKCGKASHVRPRLLPWRLLPWRAMPTSAVLSQTITLSTSYTANHTLTSTQASKRLSIRKLPPVLSFQFKVRTLCPFAPYLSARSHSFPVATSIVLTTLPLALFTAISVVTVPPLFLPLAGSVAGVPNVAHPSASPLRLRDHL